MLIPTAQGNQDLAKRQFRLKEPNGFFRYFDPITGQLRQEGKFEMGNEVGIWKEIDDKGIERQFQYVKRRIGAICKDGSSTDKTGQGACSRHGGVSQWLYEHIKIEVKKQKECSLKSNVEQLKKKVKKLLKVEKDGLEFQQFILKLILSLSQENSKLKSKMVYKQQLQNIQVLSKLIQVQRKPLKNLRKQPIFQLLGPNENKFSHLNRKNLEEQFDKMITAKKNNLQANEDEDFRSPRTKNGTDKSSEVKTCVNSDSKLGETKEVEHQQKLNDSIGMSSDLGSDSDSDFSSSWQISNSNQVENQQDDENSEFSKSSDD